MIKQFKNNMLQTYVIIDFNDEETAGTLHENQLQKDQKEFRIEKVIRRKDSKLYFKWKCYDHSFSSWIDRQMLFCDLSYFPEPAYSKNEIKI